MELDQSKMRYTTQYMLGLGFIALVTILTNYIFNNANQTQANFSQYSSLVTEQRILSQQSSFLIDQLLLNGPEGYEGVMTYLTAASARMKEAHLEVLNGNVENNINPIQSATILNIYHSETNNLDQKILSFVETLELVINSPTDSIAGIAGTIEHGNALDILNLLEEVDIQLQNENSAQIAIIERDKSIALGVILFSLVIVGLGILNPMVQQIEKDNLNILNRELRLQTLLDYADDAIISTNSNGTITSANHSAESIFSYKAGELTGINILDLIANENSQALAHNFLLDNSQKRRKTKDLEGLRKDASQFPMEASITQIDLPNEGLVYFVILRDITARKTQEKVLNRTVNELVHKNDELERFTYTVSHDLKSPLVTISGFVGMLEQDILDNDMDNISKSLGFIKNAAITMTSLLNDLLELSRVGIQKGERIQMSFNEILSNVQRDLGTLIINRNATIDVNPALPIVTVESMRFMEVFQNLIENALKYTEPGTTPHVEVGVETRPVGKNGSETIFFVKDNGRGLKPEYCEQIFDIFERVATDVEGTGVGLAIVKRIIELHDGRIWVESEGPGMGSTFYFMLPTVQEQEKLKEVADCPV